jgi:hypothetical protein
MKQYSSRLLFGLLAMMVCFVVPVFAGISSGDFELVSASMDGMLGNGVSMKAEVSGNGRYVLFLSSSTNLESSDLNGTQSDLYLYDLQTKVLEMLRPKPGGGQVGYLHMRRIDISDNGRYIAFITPDKVITEEWNGYDQVYVYDRITETIKLATKGFNGDPIDGYMSHFKLSGNGRYVVFSAESKNLGTSMAWMKQIFIRDLETGTTERVTSPLGGGSVLMGPAMNPDVSDDGRFVVYSSIATNLLPGVTDSQWHAYLTDRKTGITELIDQSTVGELGDKGVRGGYPDSRSFTVSDDGRYVTFSSDATNLVADDTNNMSDVFVRDRQERKTRRISVASDGAQGDGRSDYPRMSGQGRHVVFFSHAKNLVSDSTPSGRTNFFRYDLVSGTTELVSNKSVSGSGQMSVISDDGRVVAFEHSGQYVPQDNNWKHDIYVKTMADDLLPPVVNMTVAPDVLTPPDNRYVTVQVDGFAEAEAGLESVNITVTDEYGDMVDMVVPGFGSTVNLEAGCRSDDPDGRIYTFTAVVTDITGEQAVATAVVTVLPDTVPPVITAPADIVVEATGIQTPADIGYPIVTDDVGPVTVTNNAPYDYPLGDTVVTWTATDAFGNSSTAIQTVTVVDTTPPVLTVPSNISVPAQGSLTAVATGMATATDLVGIASIISDAPQMFPFGKTVINWTATDTSGNKAYGTQTVTTIDAWVPEVTILAPTPGGFVAYTDTAVPVSVTSSDLGEGFTLNVYLDDDLIYTGNGSGQLDEAAHLDYAGTVGSLSVGQHTVRAIVTDRAGNSSQSATTFTSYLVATVTVKPEARNNKGKGATTVFVELPGGLTSFASLGLVDNREISTGTAQYPKDVKGGNKLVLKFDRTPELMGDNFFMLEGKYYPNPQDSSEFYYWRGVDRTKK